ncbi:UNVERIFIED_CONTAM: hypothetical protein Scaly_0337600 [Sesamum calycinum]|uniref:Trafficking protein particle complex subunit 11 domain-containing protein n=1 Tax=Sesamum calycinum TaxID=2727403 RepID=A0AAW2SCP4_9LAMI
MEEYPDELRTPPIALACLVGCAEVHGLITSHLHSQQPPINTIALPDFSKISLIPQKSLLERVPSLPPASSGEIGFPSTGPGSPLLSLLFLALMMYLETPLSGSRATIRGRNIKLVVVVVTLSGHKGLLWTAVADLANAYYRDEGRRIKVRLEKRSFSSMELNVRYCFKMVGMSTKTPPIQRIVEIKTIAEQLHFKMSTLLLHSGKVVEAITWFCQHTANYRSLMGSPEVIFLHWEWLSRQYLVFAQLLETSSADVLHVPSMVSVAAEKPTEWEFHPAYYYQLAASYLKEKNVSLEFALSMSEDVGPIDGSAESVVASAYLGQFARLLEHGDTCIMQSLTDDEYVRYALAEGKRFQDSFEIIALLKRSFEAYSSLKAERTAAYCGLQMLENILLGISSAKDFIEYSLEMAALPVTSDAFEPSSKDCGPAGPATLSQRAKIHNEAFEVARGESELNLKEQNTELKVNSDYPLYLEIDLVSPLRVVLLALVAFHQPVVKPGAPSLITISLRSQLPTNVEIDQLEVQFNQSECNFIIGNGKKPHIAAISNIQPGRRVETAPSLVLATNKWLRLTYEIKSVQFCSILVMDDILIAAKAESPASMNDLPLWKFENLVETIPTKDPGLAFSGQKAIQVEEPDPQVDLSLGSSGPALVGESFILPVTVSSKGHAVYSGELKINLVDTKGGGLLSPREEEPFSADNLHVELVDISCHVPEDQSEAPSDNIQKIQPSFGLISVPSLDVGDSWSCQLKIKWNRPKPIMLYVSLGYYHQSGEPSLQKVHVHKSLQIEGKTAVTISHRAKNCSEVPLRLLSVSIEREEDNDVLYYLSMRSSENLLFMCQGKSLRRDSRVEEQFDSCGSASQVTKHRLPDVNIELPPLVVSLECPPHATLGNPFTYSVKIHNQTEFLQEIKFSIADSQSFVLSGPHHDTIFVLPRSTHVLSYMLVPLGLGSLQLPRVTVTSVRYSAGLHTSPASIVFVYPSKPHFEASDRRETRRNSVVAE